MFQRLSNHQLAWPRSRRHYQRPPRITVRSTGELRQNLVLTVQDTGGQPIFLSILELLTTSAGTVYLVVFSLAELQDDFAGCVESTASQLKSIATFAAGSPIILAGTPHWLEADVVPGDLRLLLSRPTVEKPP